ncbi:putative sporulation protein YtxC [Heliobacterium gestii]|uniref:Putative sporulation protein YtxC n=1 Tax=Heliomicrobium gestii TaxID=2699 RepID=A0A845LC41_HELGE|nr:putative sporulation protein YtxC [Heliomicrobium gestii]MBM7866184.1 putative sporulation protein YtxC [Heliomicrobium gestii]MZP42490.1 putative sporulation protein YtxC [Heliomicrobium gestii]
MSAILSIGASRSLDGLNQRLTQEIQALAGEGWRLSMRQERSNGVHQLTCFLEEHPAGESSNEMTLILRQFGARVLMEWILEVWERDLIMKRLRSDHPHFNEQERRVIGEKAAHIMKRKEEVSKEYIMYRIGRNQRILERLVEVLVDYGRIHVDGFLRFRLKDYLHSVSDAVDTAVDEYMMEKEYNEFIRLLRYFLEIQESRVQVVHVFLRPGGFQLLDDGGNPVNNEVVDGFNRDYLEHEEISFEDLLISALVTVAPVQVVLHSREEMPVSETLSTIQAVFGDRLHRCPGCERCQAFVAAREPREMQT